MHLAILVGLLHRDPGPALLANLRDLCALGADDAAHAGNRELEDDLVFARSWALAEALLAIAAIARALLICPCCTRRVRFLTDHGLRFHNLLGSAADLELALVVVHILCGDARARALTNAVDRRACLANDTAHDVPWQPDKLEALPSAAAASAPPAPTAAFAAAAAAAPTSAATAAVPVSPRAAILAALRTRGTATRHARPARPHGGVHASRVARHRRHGPVAAAHHAREHPLAAHAPHGRVHARVETGHAHGPLGAPSTSSAAVRALAPASLPPIWTRAGVSILSPGRHVATEGILFPHRWGSAGGSLPRRWSPLRRRSP
mmetsp:Transcript_76701/g.171974  ORF Transcript_76701/g.171974 Transcript_76701/m.171974 type:complete len:321 (+) Transcript_76701:474-1436(+)